MKYIATVFCPLSPESQIFCPCDMYAKAKTVQPRGHETGVSVKKEIVNSYYYFNNWS